MNDESPATPASLLADAEDDLLSDLDEVVAIHVSDNLLDRMRTAGAKLLTINPDGTLEINAKKRRKVLDVERFANLCRLELDTLFALTHDYDIAIHVDADGSFAFDGEPRAPQHTCLDCQAKAKLTAN